MKVQKRTGKIVSYDESKIINAVKKAFEQSGVNTVNESQLHEMVGYIHKTLKSDILKVEDIQDIIIEWLHYKGFHKTGTYFTRYRERRAIARGSVVDSISLVSEYLGKLDDMAIHENSSTMYSLQGLNNHVFSSVSEKYWLSLYSDEIKTAFNSGRLHIHDLQVLGAYCCGWDLKQIIMEGFGGVPGKPSSAPAKHFSSILSQANNFIFTLQGESAGAQAFSNFNTLLAPFVANDNLTYNQVKQEIQQFIFNLNISTRVGFMAPFSNITLDLDATKTTFANSPAIIGGKMIDKNYGDFSKEATWINQAIVEVLGEGDRDGAMLSYPIVTFNVTKDFPWRNKLGKTILDTTAKYGSFYFANYINSDYTDSDITSMCCRLRIDRKEIEKHLGDYTGGLEEDDYNETHQKGGGFFGAAPNTGSIGVVTLGLPSIMYDVKNDNPDSDDDEIWELYLESIKNYMDMSIESLMKKRKVVEDYAEKGLYPYLSHYLKDVKNRTGHYFTQHFSTICTNGAHEALVVYGYKDGIMSESGVDKAENLLKFMNEYTVELQKKHHVLVNLEQSPAESAGVKLCLKSGVDPLNNGYYTNSTWQPADADMDIFEQINMQGRLNVYYTGGSSMHTYTQNDLVPIKNDLNKIINYAFTETKIPYMTISPVFSVCENCGRIPGKHVKCPKCGGDHLEIYERVVGYYRAHTNWNKGKLKESSNRKYLNIK